MADIPLVTPVVTATVWAPGATQPLAGKGGAMRAAPVPAGTVAPRHSHPFEQFLYVAGGSGTLQHEGGNVVLAPGTALHLPAGAWHSATFDADTVLVEVNLNPL